MMRILAAKYGTATSPAAEVNVPPDDAYGAKENVIARREDPQPSLDLPRSSMLDTFEVALFAKGSNALAATTIAESVKLDWQEAPQAEAARLKQEAVDPETEQQKNIEALRPGTARYTMRNANRTPQ
jgi:hypothetical protein